MKLNTAHRGTPHLTAENAADLNRGIVGAGSYVLPVGTQFRADLVTNNLLKIYDGCGCMQGRQVSIEKGLSDEIEIENGTQGEKRIDLVVARYIMDVNTGVEDIEVKLLKGTPSEEAPTAPDYIKGDVRAGDTTADWPLYEIELDGIAVVEVRPVFDILYNAADLKAEIAALNSKLLQVKMISGTTSASGNLALGLSPSEYEVLTANKSGGYICIPYIDTAGTSWAIHVRDSGNFEAKKNTALNNVRIIYIPKL